MLALFLLASLCPTVQVCTFAYEMKTTIWTGSVGLLRFTFACCSCCFSSFPHLFRQHLQRTVHTKLKIVWSRKNCVSDMLYLHLFPRFFVIVRLLCVCVCSLLLLLLFFCHFHFFISQQLFRRVAQNPFGRLSYSKRKLSQVLNETFMNFRCSCWSVVIVLVFSCFLLLLLLEHVFLARFGYAYCLCDRAYVLSSVRVYCLFTIFMFPEFCFCFSFCFCFHFHFSFYFHGSSFSLHRYHFQIRVLVNCFSLPPFCKGLPDILTF